MIDRSVIRIVQTPSPVSALWRAAIASACQERGWVYTEFWGGEPPVLDETKRHVVLSWSVDDALPVSQWVLIACEPSEAISSLESQHQLPVSDARYHASGRFAAMSMLAMKGAPVFQDSWAELDIPGLGRVELGSLPTKRVRDVSCPLSMYDSLPPAIGCTALWPPEIFSYDTPQYGDGEIALLGRRRLLFNGPNLSLCAGVWSVNAQIDIDPAPRAELLVEWGHGYETSKLEHAFTEPGRFEFLLRHEWNLAAPADFRISLMLPALDGRIAFRRLAVRREA